MVQARVHYNLYPPHIMLVFLCCGFLACVIKKKLT